MSLFSAEKLAKIKKQSKEFFEFACKNPLIPRPTQRSEKAQKLADQFCARLQLYYLPTCPFCVKVRYKIFALNLNIQLVNIMEDSNRKQLIENGGSKQVPCLRVLAISENEKDKWIYESEVINRYLEENFRLLV